MYRLCGTVEIGAGVRAAAVLAASLALWVPSSAWAQATPPQQPASILDETPPFVGGGRAPAGPQQFSPQPTGPQQGGARVGGAPAGAGANSAPLPPAQGSVRGDAASGAQLPAELDSRRQASGDLPPLRRSADPLLPLGQIQPGWTDPVPAPGQRAPGVLRVRYERDRVIAVRTRVQMSTTIQLPGCEKIEDIYPGDGYAFQIVQPRENIVVVRPEFAGVDTSLAIVSAAGNSYTFYLRSEPIETRTVSDLAVFVEAPGLCRSGPGPTVRPTLMGRNGEMAAAARGGRGGSDYLREIPFDFSKLDFDCCRIYAGTQNDASIAPVRVFSDDVHTYVDFGEKSDRIAAPAAFLLRDGIDQPVNTRVAGSRGQILVIEAIGDITLKSGERVICIRSTREARLGETSSARNAVVVDPDLGRQRSRRF